jgi:hypothetical protein
MLNEAPDITLSRWRWHRSSIWDFSWLIPRPSSSICKVHATEYRVQYHKDPSQRGWHHKHSSAGKISCGADNCDYSNYSLKLKPCHSLGRSYTSRFWPGPRGISFFLALGQTAVSRSPLFPLVWSRLFNVFKGVRVIKHLIVFMWVCLSRLLPLFLLNIPSI